MWLAMAKGGIWEAETYVGHPDVWCHDAPSHVAWLAGLARQRLTGATTEELE